MTGLYRSHLCANFVQIETVNPKVIIPMHTERAEEFSSIPEFALYKDRVKVLKDGEPLDLDAL